MVYGKLFTKPLVQADNKKLSSCKNWTVAFILSVFSEKTLQKSSKKTLS